MVLVGNKCDLQAWAVDMNQARDVRIFKPLLKSTSSNDLSIYFRLQSSTAFPLLRHRLKHEWELMMHFTRWSERFVKIKSGEGKKAKASIEASVGAKIAVFDANCYKETSNHLKKLKHAHALFRFPFFTGRFGSSNINSD